MSLSAEDLARVTQSVVPLLVPVLRESRAANRDPRGDGVDPRVDLTMWFADYGHPTRRNALLSRVGLVDGAVSESEFAGIVDVAMLQL